MTAPTLAARLRETFVCNCDFKERTDDAALPAGFVRHANWCNTQKPEAAIAIEAADTLDAHEQEKRRLQIARVGDAETIGRLMCEAEAAEAALTEARQEMVDLQHQGVEWEGAALEAQQALAEARQRLAALTAENERLRKDWDTQPWVVVVSSGVWSRCYGMFATYDDTMAWVRSNQFDVAEVEARPVYPALTPSPSQEPQR